jgi:hypothetical protein
MAKFTPFHLMIHDENKCHEHGIACKKKTSLQGETIWLIYNVKVKYSGIMTAVKLADIRQFDGCVKGDSRRLIADIHYSL